ncbi:hypothetical protein RRG08_021632 [Elysia crispata]|uniref:Uncharacterized protein n=1 Tax=Elysia crispata TaxID=231223 RepID=A0AAE0XE28_9GAST|nr:hypothetical protein RRG08_021632 [Elysia crispata]
MISGRCEVWGHTNRTRQWLAATRGFYECTTPVITGHKPGEGVTSQPVSALSQTPSRQPVLPPMVATTAWDLTTGVTACQVRPARGQKSQRAEVTD